MYHVRRHIMSQAIPIGGWVNFPGKGGRGFIENPGEGVVKKRQSPDLRSPEVGISVTITLFGIYLVNKMIKYDEWR